MCLYLGARRFTHAGMLTECNALPVFCRNASFVNTLPERPGWGLPGRRAALRQLRDGLLCDSRREQETRHPTVICIWNTLFINSIRMSLKKVKQMFGKDLTQNTCSLIIGLKEQMFKEGARMTYAMPHRSFSTAPAAMRRSRAASCRVVYRVADRRRFLSILSFLVIILILMASILSAKASTSLGTPTDFIVVMEGDTLWELAETHCSKGDLRSYIYEVRQLNGLQSNTIYPGQGLLLPVR